MEDLHLGQFVAAVAAAEAAGEAADAGAAPLVGAGKGRASAGSGEEDEEGAFADEAGGVSAAEQTAAEQGAGASGDMPGAPSAAVGGRVKQPDCWSAANPHTLRRRIYRSHCLPVCNPVAILPPPC